MARISSTVGLVSGINSKDIIDQLISLEERPKTNLQARIATETTKKTAYTTLQAQLTSLRLFATQIKKPQTFRNADVKSADEGIVTGTAAPGAAAGSYQVSVARLVSSQQTIGRGYADTDRTRVGAGTITLELGGSTLNEPTGLDDLNGGKGVHRGAFRLTDRSGKSTVIDAGDALTLNDVVDKINTSLDVSIRASVKDSRLVLTDQTGQTTSALRVEDIGDGSAAADLGIAGASNATTLTGTALNGVAATTAIALLNDGRGIRTAGPATPDFRVTTADGSAFDVALGSVATIGEAVDKINAKLGAKATASLDTTTGRLQITDRSSNYADPNAPVGSPIQIAALNGSNAAADLGLANRAASPTGTISGNALGGGVNTTKVSSLRGGKGLDLGTIRIKDRAGVSSDVDLGGAGTVEEILDRINAADANVRAEVKSGGNSIQIVDLTDRTGALTISDVTGTAAAQTGLAGTFNAGTGDGIAHGSNLQKAWFSPHTLLRDLNGGKGVPEGSFTITDSAGKAKTITLDPTKDVSVGDLIAKINAGTVSKVTASINENGDGLLLTDAAGGAGKLKVAELGNGTTAKALNLAGTADALTIDGTYERTIAIKATDTLDDVQKAIQDANVGLSATIVNDGTAQTPYRLSLTSVNSGKAGQVVFDSGQVALGERTLAHAQDAALFVGGGDGAEPLLVRSASNEVSGAIRGVTLTLNGVSERPVTVNIARNVDNIVASAGTFVEGFNALVTQLKTYTKFDTSTNTRGELLGDTAAQSIETEVYGLLNTVGSTSGKYRIAADVGLKLGTSGELEFDEDKFRAAFADDPEGVTTLFTRSGAALGDDAPLSVIRNNQGVRSAPGKDFRISTRDGSNFDVDVSDLTNFGQLLRAINDADGNAGKVKASINASGTGINLLDSTTGAKTFVVGTLNGSIAASDLGLLTSATAGTITGRPLVSVNAGNDGGIGTIFEKRLNRLIDPVNGTLTQASKSVDDRNAQFQDRIDSIDKLVAAKRSRLELQFANLESSLSNLQGQQTALGSLSR